MRTEPHSRSHSPAVRRLTAFFLAAATLAVFWGVLRNDWVLLDDPLYVTANPHVNRGLTAEGIGWCFRGPHGGNWHPLTSLSHLTDVQLFGLSPRGHHAVGLALHAANAILVLLVLARMSGAWWRAALAAAFFALHPLRVESVAWVSERKDLLCAFFFLLALGAYQLDRERPSRARRAALFLFAGLALLSKPMAVTLPFVVLILDRYPLAAQPASGRKPRPAPAAAAGGLPRSAPLFALAAVSAAVTLLVQRASGAVVTVETIPIGHRIANALVSYWRYVGQTLRPAGLAVFYPFPQTPRPLVAAAAGLGLGLVTWAVVRRRDRPYLAAGWLWFAVMLLPVIGLVQVGGQSHADRYTYLPSIGLVIAGVWGLGDAARRARVPGMVATIAALALLAILSVATARQVTRWRDTRTLFTHALAVTRDNPVAHLYLGDVLLLENRVDEAIPHYRESARLAPRFHEPLNKLGSALGARGRYEEAAELFRRALRFADTADLHHNLGFALSNLSRPAEAIAEYETALAIDPGHAPSLRHLGEALESQGRLDESARRLRRAVEIAPDDPEAWRALAATLTRSGLVEEAIESYGEILSRDPVDLDALVNVAWIRATHAEAAHRDGGAAVAMAGRARAAAGDSVAVIEATLAAAYAEAGRFAEAVASGERAVALARAAGASDEAARYAEQLDRFRRGEAFHFAR